MEAHECPRQALNHDITSLPSRSLMHGRIRNKVINGRVLVHTEDDGIYRCANTRLLRNDNCEDNIHAKKASCYVMVRGNRPCSSEFREVETLEHELRQSGTQ